MKRPLISLAIASVISLLFLSQGIEAPFQKNEQEARPASLIVDVVQHKNWLIPLDSYSRPTRKPPLYYWLSALAAKARGGVVDEAGARLISLFAGVAIGGIVLVCASDYFGVAGGWLAWLFLLGIYGFASRAAHVRTDMLFTCFLLGAYCLIFPMALGKESRGRALAAGFVLGLAVLTKGPLAILLCGLAVAIYFALAGRNPLRLATRKWAWIVLILSALIGCVWYVPAFLSDPHLFAIQFVQENLGHFFSPNMGGTGESARPFYYMWLRFMGAALPLILYAPAALIVAFKARKSHSAALYHLAFILAVLGVFTIANSKRDIYILPALPALAILICVPFAGWARGSSVTGSLENRLVKIASALAAVAMLLLAIAGLILASRPALVKLITAGMQSSDAAYTHLFLGDFSGGRIRFIATMAAITAASIAALAFLWKHRARGAAACVGVASLAAVSLWIGILRPELARERTLKQFVARVEQVVGGEEVRILGLPQYQVAYYFKRAVPVWRWRNRAALSRPGPFYVLAWSAQLDHRGPARAAAGKALLESHAVHGHGRLLLLNLGASAGTKAEY